MSSPLLTSAEVAQILRVSPLTVTDMCRTAEIPATKVGKSWRISRADLDAYLAANHNQRAAS